MQIGRCADCGKIRLVEFIATRPYGPFILFCKSCGALNSRHRQKRRLTRVGIGILKILVLLIVLGFLFLPLFF